MTGLAAGSAFLNIDVPKLGGGTLNLGKPDGAHDWKLVVVYRGLHCPLCKKYLAQLNEKVAEYSVLGVDIVAVSGDGEAKAQCMVDEMDLSFPMGYGLSVVQMAQLGLYISDPRSPQEADQPFPEPSLFVVNADGNIQILDISNAPFARPDLQSIANGIKFIRGNEYPIRGMHVAA